MLFKRFFQTIINKFAKKHRQPAKVFPFKSTHLNNYSFAFDIDNEQKEFIIAVDVLEDLDSFVYNVENIIDSKNTIIQKQKELLDKQTNLLNALIKEANEVTE